MSERDEQSYGLGVSIYGSGDIQLREPIAPTDDLGWELVSRTLLWNSQILQIDGKTGDGTLTLPHSGTIIYNVQALQANYGTTSIQYEEAWINTTHHWFEDENGILKVVDKKAVLTQIEFTSDHNVIRANDKNILTGGERYNAVEFVRDPYYNAPITQERWTTESNSKIRAKSKMEIYRYSHRHPLQIGRHWHFARFYV